MSMIAAACCKRHLLVVDDDPSVCQAVEMILKLDGHLVETVSSGSEALSVFAPGKFDLIFTDYFMPSMTGDKARGRYQASRTRPTRRDAYGVS